jgi:hypothetical protein
MITFAVLGFSIELRRARDVVLSEARRREEAHMLRSRVRKRVYVAFAIGPRNPRNYSHCHLVEWPERVPCESVMLEGVNLEVQAAD